METWFYYILAALFCYGGIDFTHKAAARADCPTYLVVRVTAIVVAGLSLFAMLVTQSGMSAWQDILLYAVINSTFFALGSMARITALKKLPAAYVFPVAKLNSVLLILIAVIFFGDRPSLAQWAGIALSLLLVLFVGSSLSRDSGESTGAVGGAGGADNDAPDGALAAKPALARVPEQTFPREGRMAGFLLALAAASCVTISVVAGKFASTSVPLFSYMFVSYALVVFHTLCIERVFTRSRKTRPPCRRLRANILFTRSRKTRPTDAVRREALLQEAGVKRACIYGGCVGVLNFAGYYLILNALAEGPLALIQGISSTSFVIPIVLSAFIFKERLNLRRSLVVACAIAAVILQQ